MIQDAPLLSALLRHAKQGRISLHMPGHQAGIGFPESIRSQLVELDVTELSVTDDLNAPAGPAYLAMTAAAAAFGAAQTLFVTGGSTTALYAMVTAFCPRGSKIAVPRAVHRSVMNIAAILELTVVFIPAESDFPIKGSDEALTPVPPPRATTLRATLEAHPDTRAVLVTSPDYYGTCPDLQSLADECEQAGCPLLVDEAHGAHLCFAPHLLPPSAMASGAAACVQSAHKTLPALTQGAYLQVGHTAHRFLNDKGHRLCGEKIPGHEDTASSYMRSCLSLYQTSSASLMIGASLDYARAFMSHRGLDAIMSTRLAIEQFGRSLPAVFSVSSTGRKTGQGIWRDPLRVVIDVTRSGQTGFWWSQQLSHIGQDVEMADLKRIVLIPSLATFGNGLPELAEGILRINRAMDEGSKHHPLDDLDRLFMERLTQSPSPLLRVASPFLDGRQAHSVPVQEAPGFLAAEAVIAYPPGIALIWPGERIDADTLALLSELSDNGFCLHGFHGKGSQSSLRVSDPDHS